MHRFFGHISTDEYWFNGLFFQGESTENAKPFIVSGTFLNDGGDVLFQGTYRFSARDVSNAFSLRLVARFAHASSAEANSGSTGALSGHLYSIDGEYELLATGGLGIAVCAHIALLPEQRLRVSGAFFYLGKLPLASGRLAHREKTVLAWATWSPYSAVGARRTVTPNPLLERTSTGLALGPRSRGSYHRPRGPSANPAESAQLKR